jgi:hypothetical protein
MKHSQVILRRRVVLPVSAGISREVVFSDQKALRKRHQSKSTTTKGMFTSETVMSQYRNNIMT